MFKHEPTYRDALSHGFALLRKHPLLLAYGLFAALLGQFGITELAVKVASIASAPRLIPQAIAYPQLILYYRWGDVHLPAAGWAWLGFLGMILLALAVVVGFVAVVSQGALIASVAQSVRRRSFPHVGKAWHVGVTHFWRLLGVNAIRKIGTMLLVMTVGWAALNVMVEQTTSIPDILVFFAVFILAVVAGLVLSFLTIYAAGYIVVEEYSFLEAMHAAWDLFRSHWLVSLEVGLVVMLVNVAAVAIALIGVFVLFIPSLLFWFFAVVSTNYLMYVIALLFGLLLCTVFIILLGAAISAYTITVWTYIFMKMHRVGVVSRVVHWLR